jgi:hypothetical protein
VRETEKSKEGPALKGSRGRERQKKKYKGLGGL